MRYAAAVVPQTGTVTRTRRSTATIATRTATKARLSQLDADVEARQRERDVPRRQPDLGQGPGEAEAVEQAESGGHAARPAPAGAIRALPLARDLRREPDDAGGDRHLDGPLRHARQAQGRGAQGDAVPDREGRDRLDEHSRAADQEEETGDEEQVVDAAQDVLEAEQDVLAGRLPRRRRRGDLQRGRLGIDHALHDVSVGQLHADQGVRAAALQAAQPDRLTDQRLDPTRERVAQDRARALLRDRGHALHLAGPGQDGRDLRPRRAHRGRLEAGAGPAVGLHAQVQERGRERVRARRAREQHGQQGHQARAPRPHDAASADAGDAVSIRTS